jgi:hypothetical protein
MHLRSLLTKKPGRCQFEPLRQPVGDRCLMQKPGRNARLFTVLSLLVGLRMLGCRPTSSTPEAVTLSPPSPASETPIPQQPTPTPGPPTETPEPTATLLPQSTRPPVPTLESTPSPLTLKGPGVSYNGISFTIPLGLDEGVLVSMTRDSPGYTEFSFGEGHCLETGCVTVYPVESYREEILFGADIIDGLQSAIETQSMGYFPVLMAHILLRAQTQHIRFQNGTGIRAIVMAGQNLVFANNESVRYEFHGLTGDGRYYVSATFPIDVPILLSTHDPAQNTNEAAIPVPELPADDIQMGAVIREYNQEAQRQLDALDDPSFVSDLGLLDTLVGSLLIAPSTELDGIATDGAGFLEADIDYSGTWYRETFSYTKQAENIRHFILVMPESQVDRATADEVFSSISFQSSSGVLSMREDREEYAWALEYLYDAPNGHFRGQFELGTYYVAAAFVAAPISKAEAGHPDDTILHAGITGGGASTDYWRIEIEPGENAIKLNLTDRDGWACPWLYVHNGRSFERRTEILRNVRRKQNEQTEVSPIGPVEITDGAVILMVAEEKEEVSFIDDLYVIVDGTEVRAEANSWAAAKVAEKDQDYLVITGGESFEFRFKLPGSFADRLQTTASVVVSGFYVPLD